MITKKHKIATETHRDDGDKKQRCAFCVSFHLQDDFWTFAAWSQGLWNIHDCTVSWTPRCCLQPMHSCDFDRAPFGWHDPLSFKCPRPSHLSCFCQPASNLQSHPPPHPPDSAPFQAGDCKIMECTDAKVTSPCEPQTAINTTSDRSYQRSLTPAWASRRRKQVWL